VLTSNCFAGSSPERIYVCIYWCLECRERDSAYVYMDVCTYIERVKMYMGVYRERDREYIFVYGCVYIERERVYMYIWVCIKRERESIYVYM